MYNYIKWYSIVDLCNSSDPFSTYLIGNHVCTSQSSLLHSLVEFLSSVGIELCIMWFKYMFNSFSLPNSISSWNELNMYLNPVYMVRFHRKAKTLLKRNRENREVATGSSTIFEWNPGCYTWKSTYFNCRHGRYLQSEHRSLCIRRGKIGSAKGAADCQGALKEIFIYLGKCWPVTG
jgi:hypothetical protein